MKTVSPLVAVLCGECHARTWVEVEHPNVPLPFVLARNGWVLSSISPSGTEPVLLVPLCGECSVAIYGAEFLKAALAIALQHDVVSN